MATQFPDDFKCPISLEVMSDPVILSSGHTFDRPSIQRWLDAGHRTCPITNLPLPNHPSLIPNHALRSLISNFAPVSPPKSQPCHQALISHEALISALTSPESPPESKLNSLDRLARLSKRDPHLRSRLAESGAVAAVLACAGVERMQEKALSLLLSLSLDNDAKVGLVAEGAIGRVVAALIGPSATSGSRAVAATVLTSLAVVEVNKATIGAYPSAIAALVRLLSVGRGRERKEAATALFALCSFTENRRRAVACGAVPVLLRMAESGLDRAAEVLGLLAKCSEGRAEMEGIRGFVAVLGRVLRSGSARGVQYSLVTINSLCSFSHAMCLEAKREGVLEICLGLLEDDNDKIRRSACSIVRLLAGIQSTV